MTTTVRAMLNTDRKSASGYYPLVVRVIHNRKKKLIYSPYKFKESDFENEQQKAIWSETGLYSTKQIRQINRYIEAQKQHVERITIMLHKKSAGIFDVRDITAMYGVSRVYRYLFEYIDKEIQCKMDSNRFGTASLYRTTKESIKRFTKGKDILLREINYTFVSDYIDFLRGRNIQENSIQMYLRNLRSMYNKARKEGLVVVKNSPFEDVKMNGVATVKRAVNKDVMRKIAHVDLSGNREMERVRDLFLFSFYTRGMSVVDILYLKHSDIRNGNIYYVRNKTHQNIQIAITEPLQILIDKYRTDSIFVLPYLTQSSRSSLYRQYRNAVVFINKYLKQIGVILRLEIPLTTYVARHSWATIAKCEGAPIATISEGLGHTSEKTTQIYLKSFDCSIIDEVNAKVILL